MQIKLLCVQTFFGHWSQHSGYHQFLNYLGDNFNIELIRLKRGQQEGIARFFISPILSFTRKKWLNSWTTGNDILQEIRLIKYAYNHLKKGQKIIIHFLDGEIGFNCFHLFSCLLRNRKNLKIIASYHQPPDILQDIIRKKDKIASLDSIFLVGSSQREFFSFIPEKKIHFVPHGISSDFFNPAKRPKRTTKKYCITVGHWLRDFTTLAEIIENAPANFIFRIVGGGKKTVFLTGKKNVELYNGITDEELLTLYQDSDIGIMPLLDSTANNGLLEMMACGLPIITSDVGSVSDYIRHDDGILLKENNHNLFLEKMQELAGNPQLVEKLAFNARQRAKGLSWPTIAQQMKAVYLSNQFVAGEES